jgi:predicted site-specific integrase-resolvase
MQVRARYGIDHRLLYRIRRSGKVDMLRLGGKSYRYDAADMDKLLSGGQKTGEVE